MSQATRDFVTSYLTERGVPVAVAAGIAGNLAVESDNFAADVISGKRGGDNGKSKGVGQWQGSRLTNLQEFARETGRDWTDLEVQLDFVAEEMTPGSHYADPIASKNVAAIFGAETPEDAAKAFSTHYERPSQPHTGRRTEAAQQAFEGWFSARTTSAPVPSFRDEPVVATPASTREITPGAGLANLAPRGLAGIDYNMGPQRPNPPGQEIQSIVQDAVTDVLGPDHTVSIISGRGEYGSNRHRGEIGRAMDFDIIAPNGLPVTNRQALTDVAQAAMAKGAKGWGYGPEYMGFGRMHMDTVMPGPRQAHTWGSVGRAERGRMADAMNFALMPESYYQREMPATMAVPASRAQAFAPAPQQGPAARSAQEASMAALAAQTTPPSARAAEASSMTAFNALPKQETLTEVAATPNKAAQGYQQYAQSMTQAGRLNQAKAAAPQVALPAPATTATIPAAVPAALPVAPKQTLPPVTTRNIPSLTRAPVAPVAAQVAPSTPSVPTGLQAIEGLFSAQAGATAKPSWEPGTTFTSLGDGRVSMTNRFGVTRDVTSDWGRTPTGKTGSIFSEGVFTGKSNNPSGRGGMRNAVVGGLGGLGGSIIGSAFGPIGGLVGGAIGRNLALSRFGAAQPIPLTALDLAAINAVASGLAFPSVPAPPEGSSPWGGWADSGRGSRDAAIGISPGATAAIDAGRAGLY